MQHEINHCKPPFLCRFASFTEMIHYLLILVAPPKAVACFGSAIPNAGSINFLEVIENRTLSTTCSAYGDPIPFIQCYLLNKKGKIDHRQISAKRKRNFTSARPLQFYIVKRSVIIIECELDGGYFSGKVKRWNHVVVACKYLFVSSLNAQIFRILKNVGVKLHHISL